MRYFFVVCAVVLCLLSSIPITPTFASEDNENNFARITDTEVFLYKSASDEKTYENIFFKLPTSYFVKILNEAEDYFYVEFDGINGYVKQSQVTKVYKTPTTPFPEDIFFEINKSVAAAVKTLPSVNGDLIGFAMSQEKLKFYGSCEGDEAISGLGNIWFFTEFYQDDNIIKGYIYAPLTENLTTIPPNTEELPTTPPQTTDTSILSENITNPNSLSLIGILLLVVFLLFLVTFLPFHLGKNKTKTALTDNN